MNNNNNNNNEFLKNVLINNKKVEQLPTYGFQPMPASPPKILMLYIINLCFFTVKMSFVCTLRTYCIMYM